MRFLLLLLALETLVAALVTSHNGSDSSRSHRQRFLTRGKSAPGSDDGQLSDSELLDELDRQHAEAMRIYNSDKVIWLDQWAIENMELSAEQKRALPAILAGLAFLPVLGRVGKILEEIIDQLQKVFVGDGIIWQSGEHCRAYFETHGGGVNWIKTAKRHEGFSPTAGPTAHWMSSEAWVDLNKEPPIHYLYNQDGIGTYSVQFTATDRTAWGGIDGTKQCTFEGLCNPQYVFYRDGFYIVLNTWQSQGKIADCQYKKDCGGLCSSTIKDAFSSGGLIWGGNCAIPCIDQSTGGTGNIPNLKAKFMLVGDSITHGAQGDATWRYRLWEWFKMMGNNVDFVGPWQGTNGRAPSANTLPTPPGFPGESFPGSPSIGTYGTSVDPAFASSGHAAKWGAQATQVEPQIQGWVAQYQPDYLLLLIGFNDLGWWVQSPENLVGLMGNIVAKARAAKPDIRILVGNVVERTSLGAWRQDLIDGTVQYNQMLRDRLSGWWRDESPIQYIDVSSAYECRPNGGCPDAYDGLHPNSRGEYHIAQAFARNLKSVFGFRGNPFATPGNIPGKPLQKPQNFRVLAHDEGIKATWDEQLDARAFEIRYRLLGFQDWWATTGVGATTYWWTWAATGEQWEFQVRAMGDNGQASEWSELRSVTTNSRTSKAPDNIRVYPEGSDAIRFEWDPVTGYDVNRYAIIVWDMSVKDSWIQVYPSKDTTAVVRGLVSGHRYSTFMQTWVNINGRPAGARPSASREVLVGRSGVPPAPPVLRSTNLDPTTVRLQWDAVDGAAGYTLYSRNIPGRTALAAAGGGSGTSTDVGWLFPGTWNYEFCVAAYNGHLESNHPGCTTPPVYPGFEQAPNSIRAPQNLRAVNIDPVSVQLYWDVSLDNLRNFRMYVRNWKNNEVLHEAGVTTETTMGIGFLYPGTWNFEFCVTAYFVLLESPRTACVIPPVWPGFGKRDVIEETQSNITVLNTTSSEAGTPDMMDNVNLQQLFQQMQINQTFLDVPPSAPQQVGA